VRQPHEADLVIVNTCSVTAEADRSARAFIRRAHRLNPAAKIVVTGCYAQRAPEELARMEGVAAVIGNSHKGLAPEIILGLAKHSSRQVGNSLVQIQAATKLERATSEQLAAPQAVSLATLLSAQAQLAAPQVPQAVWVDDRFAYSFLEEAQLTPGAQTRPNLKIQEGCGNRCTFCVIPSTRGPSKSLPHAVVLKQVEGFVAAGGKELVLSGINLGRWGRDLSAYADESRLTLAGLVRSIFAQTALPRLRLSSIEPMDWGAELIGLMAEFGGTRLARHAHLPLQSGSDAVLRRMHRRYRPWHYVDKVQALVQAGGAELTLGADVLVGFPGETDAEFEETVALVRALPFGYLHLFPFSPRPGTPGWTMHTERPVVARVVEERMKALRALALEKSKAHRRWFVGREVEAITLHTAREMAARGRTSALTENFLPVELEGRFAANQLLRLRVNGVNGEGLLEART
jgi:threonylcarbamoyladenosine tRNA methylthiotransferase MtaB